MGQPQATVGSEVGNSIHLPSYGAGDEDFSLSIFGMLSTQAIFRFIWIFLFLLLGI